MNKKNEERGGTENEAGFVWGLRAAPQFGPVLLLTRTRDRTSIAGHRPRLAPLPLPSSYVTHNDPAIPWRRASGARRSTRGDVRPQVCSLAGVLDLGGAGEDGGLEDARLHGDRRASSGQELRSAKRRGRKGSRLPAGLRAKPPPVRPAACQARDGPAPGRSFVYFWGWARDGAIS